MKEKDRADFYNKTEDTERRKQIFRDKTVFFIIAALCAAVLIAGIVITANAGGVKTIQSAYSNSMNDTVNEIREDMHDAGENIGETLYHVANRGVIDLGDLKARSALEVLRVRESALNIVNGKNELTDITSWIEVTETCEFVVDLTKADFRVDNDTATVSISVPAPVPENFKVEKSEQLFGNSSVFSGSASDGQKLIDEQIKAADEEIRSKIMSDPDHAEKAKRSAVTIITNAVEALNKDVEGLNVIVEFVE